MLLGSEDTAINKMNKITVFLEGAMWSRKQ
jgi:hypothetical protein